MDYKIINYHYIRDNSNFKCITTEQFDEQLKYLSDNYQSISIYEFIDYLYDKGDLPKKCYTLTFDDGLIDGYNVLPIIEKYKAVAHYFIPFGLVYNRKIDSTHKVHFLLAKLGIDKLLTEFAIVFGGGKTWHDLTSTDGTSYNQWDDEDTKMLKKFLFNFNVEEKDKYVSMIFDKFFNGMNCEEELFKGLYMDYKQIKEMNETTNIYIGMHGYSHNPLGILGLKAQEREFSQIPSFADSVSYPLSSFNNHTFTLMRKFNYIFGLTTYKEENTKNTHPYLINRIDCRDL